MEIAVLCGDDRRGEGRAGEGDGGVAGEIDLEAPRQVPRPGRVSCGGVLPVYVAWPENGAAAQNLADSREGA